MIYPDFKSCEEIAPNWFTTVVLNDNFASSSGDTMLRPAMCTGFVKPNEVLNKIKPHLIQHFGPKGSALAALMNKTIEPHFLDRFCEPEHYRV